MYSQAIAHRSVVPHWFRLAGPLQVRCYGGDPAISLQILLKPFSRVGNMLGSSACDNAQRDSSAVGYASAIL